MKVWQIIMEMLIATICSASGMPSFAIFESISPWMRKERRRKSKWNASSLRRRKMTAAMKLTAWLKIVAKAAPATPRPSTPVSRKTRIRFSREDTARKMKGWRESPMPRNIALTALKPTVKSMPPPQIVT